MKEVRKEGKHEESKEGRQDKGKTKEGPVRWGLMEHRLAGLAGSSGPGGDPCLDWMITLASLEVDWIFLLESKKELEREFRSTSNESSVDSFRLRLNRVSIKTHYRNKTHYRKYLDPFGLCFSLFSITPAFFPWFLPALCFSLPPFGQL